MGRDESEHYPEDALPIVPKDLLQGRYQSPGMMVLVKFIDSLCHEFSYMLYFNSIYSYSTPGKCQW